MLNFGFEPDLMRDVGFGFVGNLFTIFTYEVFYCNVRKESVHVFHLPTLVWLL